jgi:hypothetical protein
LHRRSNGYSVPLKKEIPEMPELSLRFQEYGLRTIPLDWLRTYLQLW